MKPPHCKYCILGCHEGDAKTYKQDGLGFCKDAVFTQRETGSDDNPATLARIKCLVVSEMPTKEECNSGIAMAGDFGYSRWKRFYEPAGWQASEVGFTHLTRCYKWDAVRREPGLSGPIAKDAYKKCREYDTMYKMFKPDCAVVSQAPEDIIKTPAIYRMIVADLRKARQLLDNGYRPMVLLGDAPTKHYLPHLHGFKKWAGTWLQL